MQVEIQTDIYNEKRYGKPWIAKVEFEENGKANYNFGHFVGQKGEVGTLILEDVFPGDIVARGQKDHRAARAKSPTYFIINPNGELERLADKNTVFMRFRKRQEKSQSAVDPAMRVELALEAVAGYKEAVSKSTYSGLVDIALDIMRYASHNSIDPQAIVAEAERRFRELEE